MAAVEHPEVAEIKRTVFRALTRLRAATIKEFDTIARLETQAIEETQGWQPGKIKSHGWPMKVVEE